MSSAREVARALLERQSFILTSHARPDGDAVGSQLALAFALDQLGKSVRLLNRDPVPPPYAAFPGVSRLELVTDADALADAVVLLECSDIGRPEVNGLDKYFVVNVDHHLGNQMYGDVNWFDESAAACGEMVADVIDALGVRWTREIASHLYLAIATDTGGFRYGPITPRTFEACRRIAETGVSPAALSRQIFDSYGIGRVRLTGALLSAMDLQLENRLAVLYVDDDLLVHYGATPSDIEGLVNLPLGASEVLAVVMFKRQPADTYRVSLRSKDDVDVRSVAVAWKGGGHKNAAGCTVSGPYEEVKGQLIQAMKLAIEAGVR